MPTVLHAVRRTDRYWGGLSTDLVIVAEAIAAPRDAVARNTVSNAPWSAENAVAGAAQMVRSQI